MRIEDPEAFVDMVAQAVIDKIEERNRVISLVELVVARVVELQKEEAAASSDTTSADHEPQETAHDK